MRGLQRASRGPVITAPSLQVAVVVWLGPRSDHAAIFQPLRLGPPERWLILTGLCGGRSCCSDTALPGYQQLHGCDIWAESMFLSVGLGGAGCVHAANYTQNAATCASDGARVCTFAEVKNACTAGSGCSHDHVCATVCRAGQGRLHSTPLHCTALHYCTAPHRAALQILLLLIYRTLYSLRIPGLQNLHEATGQYLDQRRMQHDQ